MVTGPPSHILGTLESRHLVKLCNNLMRYHHHHYPSSLQMTTSGSERWSDLSKVTQLGALTLPLQGCPLGIQQTPPSLAPVLILVPRHPNIKPLLAPILHVFWGMSSPPLQPGSDPFRSCQPPLTIPGCVAAPSSLPGVFQGLICVSITWCLGHGWAPRGSSGTPRDRNAPIFISLFISTRSLVCFFLVKHLCMVGT